MGNEHASERLALERGLDALQMSLIADPRFDQRWHPSAQEVRAVTRRAGPWRRVVGVKDKHRVTHQK